MFGLFLRFCLSILIVVLFSFQPAFAQQPEVKIDRKQIREPISIGEAAMVHNPFGDVRLRSGADAKVLELSAVIQNLEPDTPAPEILVERKDKQVVFTVHTTQIKGKLDRVDLVVYVPDGVKTSVKTFHGAIEIKGVNGDVNVVSERGEITIRSVKGHVHAENQSASILVELLPGATNLPQNFQTRTGNITIYLLEGMGANVHLETSGEITTDYSIDIDYRASEEPDKIATAKLGDEKGQISARSKQGKISLLRL